MIQKQLLTILSLTVILSLNAQSHQDTFNSLTNHHGADSAELHGIILNKDEQDPLPYANIYILNMNRGTVSNEHGHFTLDISDLKLTDTLRFQYIGYQTKNITLAEIDSSSVVYLKEDIINLSELIVFGGKIPDLKTIIKNVLVYKDSNYKRITSKRQTFIRERELADMSNFKLKYKKSSIEELDRDMIRQIEERTPENVTSYTDFLGYYYFNENKDDSVRSKTDPTRMVVLKEEYLDDMNQLEKLFEGILAATKEDEYWKVKSGIFGTKLDVEEDSVETNVDSLVEHHRKSTSYNWQINYMLSYSRFTDKDQWEFLHKPGKYIFTLVGGTRVNNEDVYIIDFSPKSGGVYKGRVFISIDTYALIRADYAYAPGKTGTDIQLLGVGYKETEFAGSIYFEKKEDLYHLKYFSYRQGYEASINRSLALLKKKKRWLFDKKLNELKVGVELKVKAEESAEFLVIDEEKISRDQFMNFKQPRHIETIFVDQFDDDLWRGYSIIEPVSQMKEYKKQAVNYSE